MVVRGTTPAWRTIDSTTTDGTDVLQLEQFLASKGFTDGGRMVVDGHVTSATTAAISAWQTSLGLTGSGSVPLGEVVFTPAAVTVVSVAYGVGSIVTAGSTVIDVRSGTPYVDVSTDSSWAHVGTNVTVSLTAGRTQGRITSVVAGIARVELAADSGARDGETATVFLTRVKVADALIVPASAILRTDIAGPVVAVRGTHGLREVSITVVAAANDNVAITSTALRVGDQVRWY